MAATPIRAVYHANPRARTRGHTHTHPHSTSRAAWIRARRAGLQGSSSEPTPQAGRVPQRRWSVPPQAGCVRSPPGPAAGIQAAEHAAAHTHGHRPCTHARQSTTTTLTHPHTRQRGRTRPRAPARTHTVIYAAGGCWLAWCRLQRGYAGVGAFWDSKSPKLRSCRQVRSCRHAPSTVTSGMAIKRSELAAATRVALTGIPFSTAPRTPAPANQHHLLLQNAVAAGLASGG